MFKNQKIIINKKTFIENMVLDNHITKKDSIKAYKMVFTTFNNILMKFDIGDKLVLPKVITVEAKKPRQVADNVTKKEIRFFSKLYLNKNYEKEINLNAKSRKIKN